MKNASQQKQTIAEFELAADLSSRGRVDLALDAYRRILDRDETCAEAWFRKGLLHRENGDTQLAITALRRCMALRPADPWPAFQLAQVIGSTGIGRRWEALSLYRQAFELEPHCDEFRLNLGNVLAIAQQLGEAKSILAPLPESLPSWWAAARDNAMSSWRSARNEVRSLLSTRRQGDRQPMPAPQRLRLAQLLANLGKYKPALAIATKLMREQPHMWQAFALHASVLGRSRDPATAAAFLDSVRWLFDGDMSYEVALARFRYECGANDTAWAALAPEVRNHSQEARALASSVLLTMGEGDLLMEHCRRWMLDTPEDTAPYIFAIGAQRIRGGLRPFIDQPSSRNGRPRIDNTAHIIQFWDSEHPPLEVREAMATWRNNHPECRHMVFSEAMARDYLGLNYGREAVSCFDWCHHAAMKSDVFRIAFLAREGGAYVDADELCRRPLSSLFEELASVELIAATSADVAPYIYNSFLIARRGAQVLQLVFAQMLEALTRARNAGHRPDIWHTTGPGVLTRTLGGSIATSADASTPLLLLTQGQYSSFSVEREQMAYKQTPAGNWRLSARS